MGVIQMKRTTALIALMIAVLLGVQERSLAQRQTREGPEALRQRIEQRYNVVPITNGVALTPKNRRARTAPDRGVRCDRDQRHGRDRRRASRAVGSDADPILQLSYMDPATREAMFAATPREAAPRWMRSRRPLPAD